jgi:hypothetical protein
VSPAQGYFQPGIPIVSRIHGKALPLQYLACQLDQAPIILDQQDSHLCPPLLV